MTIRQFLSALNSNMIICTILDKNDNVIVENNIKFILNSEFHKETVDSEIMAWDIYDDGTLMICID